MIVSTMGQRGLKPTFSMVLVNVWQLPLQRKYKHRFADFAYFHGVNTPTMADFKLPIWCHWPWSWEEMCTVCSPEPAPGYHCIWPWSPSPSHSSMWPVLERSKQILPKRSLLSRGQVTTSLWSPWLLLIPPPPKAVGFTFNLFEWWHFPPKRIMLM